MKLSMKSLKIFFATLSLFLLSAVQLFAQSGSVSSPTGVVNKFPNPFGEGTATSLYGFVDFVFNKIVLPMGAVVVVFFVVYSGYLFVTANGNPEKIQTAKHAFLYVVIGAAILLGSWTIATAIKGTLCQISGNSIPNLCTSGNNSSGGGNF